jgi:tRNA G10  N-methylase Trm11
MYICITGRETDIARAELESVFVSLQILADDIVGIDFENINQSQINSLGFTKKVAKLVRNQSSLSAMAEDIAQLILADNVGNTGKLSFGISWYSQQKCDQRTYLTLAKNVKKRLQSHGRSARFIPPKANFQLNAAQVHYNSLLKKGCEVVVLDGNNESLMLARTIWEFDPDEYSKRDYNRPARDAKVGMFPPKLAQVLINVARPARDDVVVDPFCGSGVVLQEAMLAGHNVVGSDSASAMAAATRENLSWLQKQFSNTQHFDVYTADAREFDSPSKPYVIVSEGYLGPAFANPVSEQEIEPIIQDIGKLYIDFLSRVHKQANLPHCVVITLPCWQTTKGLKMLKIIDQIEKLGYTLKQFNSVSSDQLIYKRDSQIVGRQIVVLEPQPNNQEKN